jgi:HSP20 family protein
MMNLIRRKDYDAFRQLRVLDELFDRFFRTDFLGRDLSPLVTDHVVPLVDFVEKKDHALLKVELPGISKKDLKVSVTNDTVSIKGEIKREEKSDDATYYLSERAFGTFVRTVRLPFETKTEKVTASYKDGILEIKLPKKEESKGKELNIDIK